MERGESELFLFWRPFLFISVSVCIYFEREGGAGPGFGWFAGLC